MPAIHARRTSTTLTLLALLLTPFALPAQSTPAEKDLIKQIETLRSVPDAQRGARTGQIALDIRQLPAGIPKLKLAGSLSHLATEGDPGLDNLQAVTTTLGAALAENPLPPDKDGKPASPYFDLARLTRYEPVTTTLTDPQYTQALDILKSNDADVQKADFTLLDMHGKKVTLSQLRGKIVLVNFWATWCPPCRKEMPDLNLIYNHFQSQNIAILSITNEDMFKVGSFLAQTKYSYPILFDPYGTVAKQFHVDGIPKSFVFNRQGRLVAESIDMRTQLQFLNMLAKAGLTPQ